MKRVPGYPHILYDAGQSASGMWMIECQCRGCGDHWHRNCQYPSRTNEWIQRYVNLHAHCKKASGPAPIYGF